jgi:hypothetical protein
LSIVVYVTEIDNAAAQTDPWIVRCGDARESAAIDSGVDLTDGERGARGLDVGREEVIATGGKSSPVNAPRMLDRKKQVLCRCLQGSSKKECSRQCCTKE